MKLRTLTILAAILAASALMTACEAPAQNADGSNTPYIIGSYSLEKAQALLGKHAPAQGAPASSTESSIPPAPSVQPAPIGLETALELVLQQLGLTKADLTDKDFDWEYGVYELEFTAKGMDYEYKVDAYTGAILHSHSEPDDDRKEPPKETQPPVPTEPAPTDPPAPTEPPAPTQPTKPANITPEEAKAVVFAKLGIDENEVSRLKVELDDRKFEIEFRVGNVKYEFEVDARSGNILKIEKETESDVPVSPEAPDKTDSILSPEQVKQLIFAKLGITEDQAVHLKIELDDGKYELEFKVGRFEFECEVDARTGKILEIDKELDD